MPEGGLELTAADGRRYQLALEGIHVNLGLVVLTLTAENGDVCSLELSYAEFRMAER